MATERTTDVRTGTLWDPVDAPPEEIARACMQGSPKEIWDYLKHWHVWFWRLGEPPDWLKEEPDCEYDPTDPCWKWAECDPRVFNHRSTAQSYGTKQAPDDPGFMVLQCRHPNCQAEESEGGV